MPRNQQEGDSTICLHLHDAAKHGHAEEIIRTVDRDVVVIAIGHFSSLGLTELWTDNH